MDQSNDEKTLAVVMNALGTLSKWSHKVKTLDAAKDYLFEAFPAQSPAHLRYQTTLLPEIMRAAEHGRRAEVVQLIKNFSQPQ